MCHPHLAEQGIPGLVIVINKHGYERKENSKNGEKLKKEGIKDVILSGKSHVVTPKQLFFDEQTC
ncbi:hypothetical protein D3C75_1039120 [compost metagenome]